MGAVAPKTNKQKMNKKLQPLNFYVNNKNKIQLHASSFGIEAYFKKLKHDAY